MSEQKKNNEEISYRLNRIEDRLAANEGYESVENERSIKALAVLLGASLIDVYSYCMACVPA